MRTALDGRPHFFQRSTIKSKRGNGARERVFLAVAEVAAERVPGAGVRARSCRRLMAATGPRDARNNALFIPRRGH
jgi:hypothetical protein